MVFTLLHYAQAYLMYKASRGRLSYPGLLIGCFLPDLEIPVLIILGYPLSYARLVLHSIIGSLMFSWIIAYFILPIHRSVIRKLVGIKPSIEVSKYLVSVEISSLVHVLVDSLHHGYNPLLWPLTSSNITTLILFNNYELASTIMHILFLIMTITSLSLAIRLCGLRSLRLLIMRAIYAPK